MCNLYRMTRSVDEVAQLFDAVPDRGANFAREVYPGYPGLVVADGHCRAMTWGFPLQLTGKQGRKLKPRPVTNAREDKLTTPFWKSSFMSGRCLVPVSAWAEAEGEKGRMTRTWYALEGEPFAVAGLWRPSAEWGDVYTMVMVEGSPQMAEVHDRMPLILAPQDRERWLHGDAEEALGLCCTWQGMLTVEKTEELWAGNATPAEQPRLL